jgi:hypothetical protein
VPPLSNKYSLLVGRALPLSEATPHEPNIVIAPARVDKPTRKIQKPSLIESQSTKLDSIAENNQQYPPTAGGDGSSVATTSPLSR